jgi:hypothetical protein
MPKTLRTMLTGFALVGIVFGVFYLRALHRRRPREVAYAGGREVIVWSTTAQVREPVATVGFGERLIVLKRYEDEAQVRTMKGATGWVSGHDLLSADLWQNVQDLGTKTAGLPVEGRGQTRVLSNLHVTPGRSSPMVVQLPRNVSVELFQRKPLPVPSPATVMTSRAGATENSGAEMPETRMEDWWLVRADTVAQGPLAGWILGKFVDLSVPPPIPDYMSAANTRIVAWFELNRVTDVPGEPKPQYLVVGVRGAEGQPCDFTLLRVFTWAKSKQRYETAYVESELCGMLPVKLTPAKPAADGVGFAFDDLSNGESAERIYRMKDTVVRRAKEQEGASAGKGQGR